MTGTVTALFNTRGGKPVYSCAREVMHLFQPPEPAYLFCARHLQRRAQQFEQGFPGMVSYAVKANPEPRVLQTLVDQGLRHFDVASVREIQSVLAICPEAILHFNNPVKAEDAIEVAYRRYGVRSFAVDEASEIRKIQRATGHASDVMYSVRFKLEHDSATYDFGSKFGATPEAGIALLQVIATSGARAALTFHPGSQCIDPSMYARYLEAAARMLQESAVAVEMINVGGGFPEQYENSNAPALEHYFTVIEAAASKFFDSPPPLLCEPGRSMVAPAISLLSRVIHTRDDQQTLFLNDGVYGGMLEQSVADLRLPVRVWREGGIFTGDTSTYRVFGPTCDPIDRLPHEITLAKGVSAGDYIEFGLLGAYGSATSTSFNGFQSANYFNVAEGFYS